MRLGLNVTAFLGVVLALLVEVLAAMPRTLRGIEVAEVGYGPGTCGVPDYVVVDLAEGGRLLLNGIEIERVDLAPKVRERLEHSRDRTVFVRFEHSVRYGDAVSVMDTCKGAGAENVAILMPPS
jgi:biopolymer transport protein ExbD